MSEVSLSLNPLPPKPPRLKKKRSKKPKPGLEDQAKANRRALIGSIIIGSIVVHVIALLLFGLWTVAKHFTRPVARFEMKKVRQDPAEDPRAQDERREARGDGPETDLQ